MFKAWKSNSESFKRSFLLVLSYGIAFGIGYLFRFGELTVWFYVSEQKKIASYQLGLKDFVDLLCIGPIFTIISFFAIKRVFDELNQVKFSKNKESICYIVYLIAIAVFNYGNMIHVTANRLNSQVIDDYNTEAFYYSIYFLDEFIGHLLITIGFFVVFVELTFLHSITIKKREESKDTANFYMKDREPIFNCIFGVGLGAVTAEAYLEGQCAFLFLILNPLFSVILLLFAKKIKIDIRMNSLLMLFIIMTIIFTIFVVVWAFLFGIKPYYPFFYQGSELG